MISSSNAKRLERELKVLSQMVSQFIHHIYTSSMTT